MSTPTATATATAKAHVMGKGLKVSDGVKVPEDVEQLKRMQKGFKIVMDGAAGAVRAVAQDAAYAQDAADEAKETIAMLEETIRKQQKTIDQLVKDMGKQQKTIDQQAKDMRTMQNTIKYQQQGMDSSSSRITSLEQRFEALEHDTEEDDDSEHEARVQDARNEMVKSVLEEVERRAHAKAQAEARARAENDRKRKRSRWF